METFRDVEDFTKRERVRIKSQRVKKGRAAKMQNVLLTFRFAADYCSSSCSSRSNRNNNNNNNDDDGQTARMGEFHSFAPEAGVGAGVAAEPMVAPSRCCVRVGNDVRAVLCIAFLSRRPPI